MTTREQIIAAAKEAGFPEWENTDDPEFLKVIEKLYVVAFQSGAASRDAEVAQWQKIIDEEAKDSALVIIERDQLRAQINGLLEAMGRLEKYVSYNGDTWVQKEARNALSTTPEQSLAEYRNKVIEAFVNEFSRHVGGDGEFWLHELQDFAMKEQP